MLWVLQMISPLFFGLQEAQNWICNTAYWQAFISWNNFILGFIFSVLLSDFLCFDPLIYCSTRVYMKYMPQILFRTS